MPTDTSSLPEDLLVLARQATRHNDALGELTITGTEPSTALKDQIPSTQRLVKAALSAAEAVRSQPLEDTLDVRDVKARLRQVIFLTAAAADHLVDAGEIIEYAETPDQDVLLDAGRQVQMARDLSALAPEAFCEAAENIAVALRRQRLGATLPSPEISLSPAQHSALRAISRGHVQVRKADGWRHVSSHDDRLLFTTLQSLEAKGLVHRRLLFFTSDIERVHLTAAGRKALAATYGLRRPAALKAKAASKGVNTIPSAPRSR